MSGIKVWRDKPGALLGTYARVGSKVPLAQDVAPNVSAEELTALIMTREPFDPVVVSIEDAESVLGWTTEKPE